VKTAQEVTDIGLLTLYIRTVPENMTSKTWWVAL